MFWGGMGGVAPLGMWSYDRCGIGISATIVLGSVIVIRFRLHLRSV